MGQGAIFYAPDRAWQADACPPGDTGLIGAAAKYLRFFDALRGVDAPASGLGWRFG